MRSLFSGFNFKIFSSWILHRGSALDICLVPRVLGDRTWNVHCHFNNGISTEFIYNNFFLFIYIYIRIYIFIFINIYFYFLFFTFIISQFRRCPDVFSGKCSWIQQEEGGISGEYKQGCENWKACDNKRYSIKRYSILYFKKKSEVFCLFARFAIKPEENSH